MISLLGGILVANAPLSEPVIVAHRGASYDAPENTLAAFRLAWEQGADVIEGDFYLSSDGKIVCIHDKTTKRTAGTNLSVAKTPFADLRNLDVGSWKDPRFADERIPTLEEVLAIVPDGKKILIEVKCGPEIIAPMKEVIAASKLKPEQIAVIAFDSRVIAESKRKLPHLKAFWLTSYRKTPAGDLEPSIEQILTTLKEIKADGLDSNAHPELDRAFVQKLRDAKMQFHVWTVDDPGIAQKFMELGVDSITTNRPAWLRKQLRK